MKTEANPPRWAETMLQCLLKKHDAFYGSFAAAVFTVDFPLCVSVHANSSS